MSRVVLLTGAAGALGQALMAKLQRDGCCSVIATSRQYGAHHCDIRDFERLAALVHEAKPDVIFNLAATFSADFGEAYAINVDAPRKLLDCLAMTKSPARVVLIGSAAEYGIVRPEENPVSENRALRPVSVYGMTKAWQTQLAALYAARGVNVVVARIFNLWGPGLSERLFVGRLQKQIGELLAGTRSVIEVGPLSSTRDYVSLEDATGQLLAIAAHGEPGEVYHVASGKPITMREFLARFLAEHDICISAVQEAAELSNRTGYDVPMIYADVSRTSQMVESWRSSVKA